MKANPLVCALLVLLAVAVQLPAQNTNTPNAPRWADTRPVYPSGTNAAATNKLRPGKLTFSESDFSDATKQPPAGVEYNLALRYYKGDGVVKDYAEAVKWFRKAAEQNNADAQCYLGDCYDNGQGVVKDYVEAVKWYRKAAEQNNVSAQYNLGVCYDNGRGVAKDKAEAVKWIRKAAEQNNAAAQYYLGVCYAYGEGVAKDYVEAYKWENLAAANKDKYIARTAANILPWLESLMSSEQIAKAQTDRGDVVGVACGVLFGVSALFLFGLTFFRLVRYVRRMKMNRMKISVSKHNPQKIVLGLGLLLVLLNGLFPPFQETYSSKEYLGHRFLFIPPARAHIVTSLFFIQFVTIIGATAGAFFLFGMRDKKPTGNGQEKPDKPTEP